MNNKNIMVDMTLQEKAAMVTGASPWRTLSIERLGIEPLIMADGPHGLRRAKELDAMITESYQATCFPVAAALSASWDVDLLYEMGQALADEAIALNTDILLGPGLNMKRSPLCGRNFEYFSEDPQLSGEMAAALIDGIQSKGVGTSVKHFVANNQEKRRFTVDVVVDERTLHEIYLRGFEIAIKKAQPWTVMCAYNGVNGMSCSQNHNLLTGILRDQWGYEGFVVSDWGAVYDRVAALQAGLDLEMPGPLAYRTQSVIDAIQSGEMDEAVLDQAVDRLLTIILRAKATAKGHTEIDIDGQHALARRIASACLVLLKNENDVLPLDGSEQLAVIGTAAVTPVYQGGGSSHIQSTKVDAALDLLREKSELQYAAGDSSTAHDPTAIAEAVTIAQAGDVAVLFIALPASIESEGYDRAHMQLTEQQVALIKAVAAVSAKTVVVLNNGAALDMREWIDDVDAVLEAWLPGQAGAGAVVDVLYGTVNPSGKLGETFPLRLEDTPSYLNFPGERDTVRYGEGVFVGYRGYEAQDKAVLFPFGHGLSYTTFAYSNMQVSATEFTLADPLEIRVDVTNTGARDGQEVVQLYVHDVESRLPRPPKELKAFAKVALAAGETKTVTLTLDERAFSYYDADYGQWVAEAGDFDVLVGRSSAAIHLTARITLMQGTPLPPPLYLRSPLGDWLAHPRGEALVMPLLDGLYTAAEGEALGADMTDFWQDMPLTKLLAFRADQLDSTPEALVGALLNEIKG